MTKDQAIEDVLRLTGSSSKRIAKYIRNINRYFFNGFRKDPIWTQDTYPMAYWTAANPNQMLADLGTLPSLNLVRSCIDTVTSKISQTKPLPQFTPIKGTWKTRRVCKQAQIYFDDFFQGQKLYAQGVKVARDAMLFEYGVLWADDESKSVTRLAPWEFSYDPAEYNFGKMRRCNIERREYPLNLLAAKIKKFPDLAQKLAGNPGAKCTYQVYYNLDEGQVFEFADKECIAERKIKYDVAPFVMLWYRSPIKGWGSASMADSLMPIQEQVDRTTGTIHEALELSPANFIVVPKIAGAGGTSSGIKKSELSNQIGNVYEYVSAPGMSSPIEVMAPAPIDPTYLQLLKFFIDQGYQMEGVSQLSAQSKKPAGANSGVALQTLEDVESERFNAWLQDYIHMFVDLAEICIKVFPPEDDILPGRTGRSSIKWKEIVDQQKLFNVQTSPVSNLSRDPATKMEQVQKLISMQIIKPEMASSLLEFADLEKAYAVTSASYDDCQKIIERAVETGEYDFYEVVSIPQLYGEACNTLLMLDADDEAEEVLQRLVGFIRYVKQKIDTVNAATQPPSPQVVPNPAPQPPPMVQPAAPGPMPGGVA